MKPALLLLASAVVLASCAPALTASQRTGRLVNVASGQEGRITLTGATITGRGAVRVELGGEALTGEYNVLGGDARFGFGVSVGASSPGANVLFGNIQASRVPDGTRSGTIIAKSESGFVLTCDFLVDVENRGNGTCTDARGGRYAFQF